MPTTNLERAGSGLSAKSQVDLSTVRDSHDDNPENAYLRTKILQHLNSGPGFFEIFLLILAAFDQHIFYFDRKDALCEKKLFYQSNGCRA